jgi:hypothetical protein
MRLSHGFVRGETLACIYHGWQYNEDAACTYIPAHPDLTPPKSICAQSYQCEVGEDVVWVALNTTAETPPSLAGRMPLRSMEIVMPADRLARSLERKLAPVIEIGGAFDLAIAVQPSTQDSCVIHAFADESADRKLVSRHLEKLRSQLEGAL